MKNTSNRSSFASSLQQPIKHVSRSAMAAASRAFSKLTAPAKKASAALAPRASFARSAFAPKPAMASARASSPSPFQRQGPK
ncbi:MAG: hypothetical protein CMH28_03075 [Micavibrio sp.]|nr:hypothetical protein [Micavibrio sp.]|tara:strand:+ start:509 stop:754 length:246 start_codon:yes stop_codon:yes gene_type:complete